MKENNNLKWPMKKLSWLVSEFRWIYGILLLVLIYTVILQFSRDFIQIILLGIALIPGMIYIGIVRFSDVGRREPVGVVALYILVGILLIYPAIYLERIGIVTLQLFGISPVNENSILFWIIYGLIIVAPVEEGLKISGFFLTEYLHEENDEPTDSVVYMVALGGGFALFENYRYILGISGISFNDALTIGIARSFTAIPIHLGLGLLMGYYLSLYRFPHQLEEELEVSGNKWKAILIPLLLHGVYDMLVFLISNFVLTLIVAVLYALLLSIYAWRNVVRIRKIEKSIQ